MDGYDLTTLPRKRIDTFWTLVDRSAGVDACWPWKGSRNRQGYGQFSFRGRVIGAHRFVLVLCSVGIVPRRRVFACHHCDVPACCNPMHLYFGSCLDNARDAAARRVRPPKRGRDHPMAKLSDSDVREILSALRAGARSVDLAARFGVTTGAINGIRSGKTWTHIPRHAA